MSPTNHLYRDSHVSWNSHRNRFYSMKQKYHGQLMVDTYTQCLCNTETALNESQVTLVSLLSQHVNIAGDRRDSGDDADPCIPVATSSD